MGTTLQSIQEKTKQLIRLKLEKKKYEGKVSALNGSIGEIENRLLTVFEAKNLKSLQLKGMGEVHVIEEAYPTITDSDKLFSDLKKMGAGDLIRTTVNIQTLRGFCNERLATSQKLPSGVKIYYKSRIGFRKGTTIIK